MLYFVVEYRGKYVILFRFFVYFIERLECFNFFLIRLTRGNQDWTLVSNSVKPGGNFVVLDLSPATWYNLRVTAHNNAGSTVAEYEFATLTLTGGTVVSTNLRKLLLSSCIFVLFTKLSKVVAFTSALLFKEDISSGLVCLV